MRVKIADVWYDVTPDTPIMVELSDADKFNIGNMPTRNTKYACFHDDDAVRNTPDTKLAWMKLPS